MAFYKLLLTILDGWGLNENAENNAIAMGNTPTWDRLNTTYSNAKLVTFGEAVGLPKKQMGNSEVGHMNIGAGRVVYQDLTKINQSIENDILDKDPLIQNIASITQQYHSHLHILGLLSDGGIHSHIDHILAITEIFTKFKIPIWLHIFTDGRDTPPKSAAIYLKKLNQLIKKQPNLLKIATVSGRYYAMDRDNRWDRTELVYKAIVEGMAPRFDTAEKAIENQYSKGIEDEFLLPMVIGDYCGIANNDNIFVANFRSDRMRQLLQSLVIPSFNKFNINNKPKIHQALGMVSYSDQLNYHMKILFPNPLFENTLGEWLAKHNLKQLRVAETEKYPHVTFFFNCGRETPFINEERIMEPSPKVSTYDLKPKMSANEITDHLIKALKKDYYDFIVINYANGDMVGHTGNLKAAIKTVEVVDECLARIEKAVRDNGYIWLIIADHGNCECMWDYINHAPHTQHTTNLVPIILVNDPKHHQVLDGKLADIAPTILKLMNINIPTQMTGNIIVKNDSHHK